MDYTPRYAQPFTLAEALSFDVSVITEEIARLQNSIQHLERTQKMLEEALADTEEPDHELKESYDENQGVIASQRERISILEMALRERGIVGGSHYEPTAEADNSVDAEAELESAGVYL